MSAKVFVDTNIFVYLYSVDEAEKSSRAAAALSTHDCVVSTQVLNEFCNFCIKKWQLAAADIAAALTEICAACSLQQVSGNTVRQALKLHERYGYAYYDCLMLASALASGCKFLLSEDMADGQIIDGMLEIVNIFGREIK